MGHHKTLQLLLISLYCFKFAIIKPIPRRFTGPKQNLPSLRYYLDSL